MEKKFKHFLSVLLMCFIAVSLTACGGNEDEPYNPDDQDEPENSFEPNLVGTWTNDIDTTLTLRADRTGEETYCGKTYTFKDWTYNPSTTEVTAMFTSGGSKGKVCHLLYVSDFTGYAFYDCTSDVVWTRL